MCGSNKRYQDSLLAGFIPNLGFGPVWWQLRLRSAADHSLCQTSCQAFVKGAQSGLTYPHICVGIAKLAASSAQENLIQKAARK